MCGHTAGLKRTRVTPAWVLGLSLLCLATTFSSFADNVQPEANPSVRPAYSSIIEAVSQPEIATVALKGDRVISFAYRYKQTAVLTQDVEGHSITLSRVQAHAGDVGYYAGTFIGRSGANGAPHDMWCFHKSPTGDAKNILCLYRNMPSLAAIVDQMSNPLLVSSFSSNGIYDYVESPVFEQRPVSIPGNLVLEYRFVRWRDDSVVLAEFAGGQWVRDLKISRAPDGSAFLDTLVGRVMVSPIPQEDAKAAVQFSPL